MSKIIELLLSIIRAIETAYKIYKKKRSDDFKRAVHDDPVSMLCKQLNPNYKDNSNATNSTEHTADDEQR